MSIKALRDGVSTAIKDRINKESSAMRGTMKNGRFYSGNKSYPAKQAVECNVNNGHKVWATRTNDGKAVIVGA